MLWSILSECLSLQFKYVIFHVWGCSFVTRDFNKGQAPGKLTSCQLILSSWFDHLEERLSFRSLVRKVFLPVVTSCHPSKNFNETPLLLLDFFSRYDTTTGLLKIQRSVAFEKVTLTFFKINYSSYLQDIRYQQHLLVSFHSFSLETKHLIMIAWGCLWAKYMYQLWFTSG